MPLTGCIVEKTTPGGFQLRWQEIVRLNGRRSEVCVLTHVGCRCKLTCDSIGKHVRGFDNGLKIDARADCLVNFRAKYSRLMNDLLICLILDFSCFG